jgi:hypothetical protein
MGMWLKKEDRIRSLIEDRDRANLAYGNNSYRLDLRAVEESPFAFSNPHPQPRTEAMKRTLLFQGLADLFDVSLDEDRDTVSKRQGRVFLPSVAGQEAEHGELQNAWLRLALPEAAVFHPQQFQDVRADVISFLLGGGACALNNIRMAESFARLATGRKVSASFEAGTSNPEPLPLPVGDRAWRQRHLIDPLRGMAEGGAVATLRNSVLGPYQLMYKSGTLNDDAQWESEYMGFVLGPYDGRQFEAGRTLAGFLWLERSKRITDPMRKFSFAAGVVRELTTYLERRNGSRTP